MKAYQTLTLIGGIFGIVMVPLILISIGAALSVLSAFQPNSNIDPKALGESTVYSIIISIIISIISIVIAFVLKKAKTVGYILLGLAVIMLMATNISGILSWILFFVGGISAIKLKVLDGEHIKKSEDSSLSILKERFAKGEITKEEFDKIKIRFERLDPRLFLFSKQIPHTFIYANRATSST